MRHVMIAFDIEKVEWHILKSNWTYYFVEYDIINVQVDFCSVKIPLTLIDLNAKHIIYAFDFSNVECIIDKLHST